jgi:hypothetical protein
MNPLPPGSPHIVECLLPQLVGSGVGGMVWWKLRTLPENQLGAFSGLRDAYRINALQRALQEHEIQQLFDQFRAAGIEPILIKGWALARLYGSCGMRPAGDIDLLVSHGDLSTAQKLRQRFSGNRFAIDLTHRDLAERMHTGERPFQELYARSELVPLANTKIRVLSAEDSLRTVCFHFLRHGAWRPLWLCDVAVALETRPASFDWDYCLGSDPTGANWVVTALALSHRLVGAQIQDTPVEVSCLEAPDWVVATVLREWKHPTLQERTNKPYLTLRRWLLIPRRSLERWPNPILAVVATDHRFENKSPFVHQLLHFCKLIINWTTRVLTGRNLIGKSHSTDVV